MLYTQAKKYHVKRKRGCVHEALVFQKSPPDRIQTGNFLKTS